MSCTNCYAKTLSSVSNAVRHPNACFSVCGCRPSTATRSGACTKRWSRLRSTPCTFRSPEIVLILGESYNKHHAALYGYPLPTTPRLSQEEAAGRLYPFTDVVSPANFTVKAMHLLFSFASQDRQTAWCDTPLFPALFRRAGYDTLMFDNQTTFTLENDDVWDQEIRHFLYHPDSPRSSSRIATPTNTRSTKDCLPISTDKTFASAIRTGSRSST